MSRIMVVLALTAAGCAAPVAERARIAPAERAVCVFVEREAPADVEMKTQRFPVTAEMLAGEGATADDVARTVAAFVAPESWGALHRTAIYADGGDLVVRHTPAVLAEVGTALEAMKSNRGRLLTVTVRFVSFPPERAGAIENLAPADGGLADVFDRAAVDELLSEWRREADVTLLSAPRLTLFHGQQGSISIMEQFAYISGYEKQVASGSTCWDPIIGVLNEGTSLDLCAIANGDRPGETVLHFRVDWGSFSRAREGMTSVAFDGRRVELPSFSRAGVSGNVPLRADQALLVMFAEPRETEDPDRVIVAVIQADWNR